MRLNIEWKAPWMHGKPFRTWVWHKWYKPKGLIRGKQSFGCTVFGFYISFTLDALWSGVSFSINIYEHKTH